MIKNALCATGVGISLMSPALAEPMTTAEKSYRFEVTPLLIQQNITQANIFHCFSLNPNTCPNTLQILNERERAFLFVDYQSKFLDTKNSKHLPPLHKDIQITQQYVSDRIRQITSTYKTPLVISVGMGESESLDIIPSAKQILDQQNLTSEYIVKKSDNIQDDPIALKSLISALQDIGTIEIIGGFNEQACVRYSIQALVSAGKTVILNEQSSSDPQSIQWFLFGHASLGQIQKELQRGGSILYTLEKKIGGYHTQISGE